jgi:hypothetical protein
LWFILVIRINWAYLNKKLFLIIQLFHSIYFYEISFNLTVPPQIAPIIFGDDPANWGEQVSSMCSVLKGDEPIIIEWKLNGKIILAKTHPDITISRTGKKLSVLNIDSAAANHTGEYTCIASNFAGSSNRSAILSINGTKLFRRLELYIKKSFVMFHANTVLDNPYAQILIYCRILSLKL